MKSDKSGNNTKGLSIGDVAKFCKIPDHTIRYWEQEFSNKLVPSRTKGKQRRYSDADIKILLKIKKLLWFDNFSIKGAKRILDGNLSTSGIINNNIMPHDVDTESLAMHIAQLITQQKSQIESAA